MAKLLIVDDEPSVVMLLKFLLEKAGHEVAEAHNGAEALEMLGVAPPNAAAELPDLIVLDIMMPVMDGYTAAIAMRNHARVRAVPIIVLTAKSDMRAKFAGMENIAGFLTKPFDPAGLRDMIAKAVAKKPA